MTAASAAYSSRRRWRRGGGMRFDWDDGKDARNRRDRRLPFSLAELLFAGPVLERIDTRRDYGEVRVQAIGQVADVVLFCVYTDRLTGDVETRWIISLRVADRKERAEYHAWLERKKAVQSK